MADSVVKGLLQEGKSNTVVLDSYKEKRVSNRSNCPPYLLMTRYWSKDPTFLGTGLRAYLGYRNKEKEIDRENISPYVS
jgi:hypothetical protein